MTVNTSQSTNWSNLIYDDRPIEVRYQDVDIEYKEEARNELVRELGFEPVLRVSRAAEIFHRGSLRRYYSGELAEEKLNEHRKTRAQIIKDLILREVPE